MKERVHSNWHPACFLGVMSRRKNLIDSFKFNLLNATPLLPFVFITLASALGASELKWNEAPKSLAPARYSELILTQIREDILGSLAHNRSATRYSDWKSSGYTAEDVFDNTIALSSAQAFRALCDQLELLSSEDLVHFEHALIREESLITQHCGLNAIHALRKRMTNYWSNARTDLNQRIKSKRLSNRIGKIELSIEEGPSLTTTPLILEALQNHGFQASFFPTGKNASQNPQLTKRILEGGNLLGFMSWTTDMLSRTPLQTVEKDLQRSRNVLVAVTGTQPGTMRLPFGVTSASLNQIAKQNRWTPAPISIDSLDWKIRNPQTLLTHLLKEIDRMRGQTQGGIVSFHEPLTQTALVLPALLDEIQAP